METVRLLIDAPAPGPVNMARDEALLAACARPDARPVLRFYAWSPATISLGYFQDYADYERLAAPAGDLAVVRRTTGGGAILHDMEVTYALALPRDHRLVKDRPVGLYELAHNAIIAAIGREGVRMVGDDRARCGELWHRRPAGGITGETPVPQVGSEQRSRGGPFFCFDRRHALDVVYDDPTAIGGVAKIAGSAQRRTREAVLQHGLIMLDSCYDQQWLGTWSHLVGPIEFSHAVNRLLSAFERALGVELLLDEWQEEEQTTINTLALKHANTDWTRSRRRC